VQKVEFESKSESKSQMSKANLMIKPPLKPDFSSIKKEK